MCGIVGRVNLSGEPVDAALLARARDSMFHRGPDEAGQVVLEGGCVGLAMRRLSVIDLSTGSQPMFSDDRKVAIVCNGEIYNYIELREDLPPKAKLHTKSDIKVLLRLYELYGVEAFSRVRGMFAAAIWDGRSKTLVLARDRFGKKPLYYYRNAGSLIFGSEIKAILQFPHVPRVISQRGLDNFLTWLAVFEPDTMFRDIHKLEPGHYLQLRLDGSIQQDRYWRLSHPSSAQPVTRADAADLLLQKLEESIRLRLRADVPVGVLLSGGVDSSAIVALASRFSDTRLRTFSIGFDVEGFNEFRYSRAVAQRYGTDHHEFVMAGDSYWETLQDMVWHLDEPLCDTATVALFYICREAQRSVKVLLSGEGSDELLGGYEARYQNGLELLGGVARRSRFLPTWLREWLWTGFGDGEWPGENMLLWRLTQPVEYQFLKASVYGFYAGLRGDLYQGGIMEGFSPNQEPLRKRIDSLAPTLIGKMLYVDCNANLPAYLLMKADKMSMAASVELRCPFLDHVFAEFCAELPDEYKIDEAGQGKSILKQALQGVLPDDLLYRPKMGFPVPIDEWLKTRLKDPVHATLFSRDAALRELFNMGHVESMWDHHQAGTLNFGTQLWQLLLIELWMRKFEVSVA